MKSAIHPRSRDWRAMTLIELLVVISIIGVLAGLILPAVANVKTKAKVVQAQKDMADMKGAISVYQNDYGRLPASSATVTAAAAYNGDFTYGSWDSGHPINVVNGASGRYQAGNQELMLILTASTSFSNNFDSSILNNAKNPRRTAYFHAKPAPGGAGALAGPGLGTDGVMRDPWGSPYCVALDLNYDGWVSNSIYHSDVVNTFPTGLSRQGAPGTDTWALKNSVIIFSFGPDRTCASNGGILPPVAANAQPNKDNVLSWK